MRRPAGSRVLMLLRGDAGWGARRGVLPTLIAAALVLVGCRMLALLFAVFEHAYLNSYWFLPGARVSTAYWSAVRFAFQATVLVSIGIGLFIALLLLELRGASRR